MAIWVKIHERMGKKVIALCDEELLGRVYEDGIAYVDLKTYESFYRGEKKNFEEVVNLLKTAPFHSLNAFGHLSTEAVIKAGLCRKRDVRSIAHLPHIQVYKF